MRIGHVLMLRLLTWSMSTESLADVFEESCCGNGTSSTGLFQSMCSYVCTRTSRVESTRTKIDKHKIKVDG